MTSAPPPDAGPPAGGGAGKRPHEGAGDASEPPVHGALQPRGQDVAFSALGSLLAGPIVWGGVGFLLDRWLGTGRTLTAIGVVVGSLTAFYIVYLRFGRDE